MDDIAKLLLLQGQIASRQLPKGAIKTLSDVEFRVSSQFGEDGIIEWLVSHLGQIRPKFIEFGVENFHQSNCRFLMQNRNWKGLVMDASFQHIQELVR